MAQLLVRNVPAEVVDALKKRAIANGRSAEAEHRAILRATLTAARDAFWEEASRLRRATRGRIRGDSAELIRRDRDRR
ncbi:MAG TPA: Arc family DNA-binding protein [Caulobacteraceae bacterium]|nr:Arc family DNA-binding protein [Caulobacteraceae bacterium]